MCVCVCVCVCVFVCLFDLMCVHPEVILHVVDCESMCNCVRVSVIVGESEHECVCACVSESERTVVFGRFYVYVYKDACLDCR